MIKKYNKKHNLNLKRRQIYVDTMKEEEKIPPPKDEIKRETEREGKR